MISEFKYLRRS